MKATTADGHDVVVGMTVYVLSQILGGQITEHIVGSIPSTYKITYKEPDDEGYIGARLGVCYADKSKAEEALKQAE